MNFLLTPQLVYCVRVVALDDLWRRKNAPPAVEFTPVVSCKIFKRHKRQTMPRCFVSTNAEKKFLRMNRPDRLCAHSRAGKLEAFSRLLK